MIWQKSAERKWIESEQLNRLGIKHGWFSREGGLSAVPYDSLNVKRSKDDPQAKANRKLVLDSLVLPAEDLVFIRHEHAANVVLVNRSQIGKELPADAVITTEPGLVLGQGTADCNTVIIADKSAKFVGLIHSSWRSLKAGIIGRTIQEIKKLGITPSDVVAVLGPSICAKCYEFGDEAEKLFDRHYLQKIEGRYHVDLKAWVADELKKNGVSEVEDIGVCNFEDEKFFSYRRANRQDPKTGRFMTVASLPPTPSS